MPSGALSLIELFASRPAGARQWFMAFGTSMVPLAFSGEQLLVERCDEADLRVGDVVVMAIGEQVIAHTVDETAPLRTSSYLGVPDVESGRVLGKAVAVRRFGRAFPLSRRMVWFGHRVLSNRVLRDAAVGAFKAAVRGIRPVVGMLARSPELRRVESTEINRAVAFASAVLGGSAAARVLAAGGRNALWVVTSRQGLWLAIGWRDAAPCIAVARWARGLGVEAQLESAIQ